MVRACRLVVDTGLHALGWTREQAIYYMVANTGQTRASMTAEVGTLRHALIDPFYAHQP